MILKKLSLQPGGLTPEEDSGNPLESNGAGPDGVSRIRGGLCPAVNYKTYGWMIYVEHANLCNALQFGGEKVKWKGKSNNVQTLQKRSCIKHNSYVKNSISLYNFNNIINSIKLS